jgi:hypothetical protein
MASFATTLQTNLMATLRSFLMGFLSIAIICLLKLTKIPSIWIEHTGNQSHHCWLQKEPQLAIGEQYEVSTKDRACCLKRGALHVNDTPQEINQYHFRQKICCISVILPLQISICSGTVQARFVESYPLHPPPACRLLLLHFCTFASSSAHLTQSPSQKTSVCVCMAERQPKLTDRYERWEKDV